MPSMLSKEFLIPYFLIINLLAFGAMFIDKKKAQKGKWRISEWTLMMLAAAGGSIGANYGMKKFRHKTKKPKFYIGLPLILFLQLIVIGIIIYLRYS